MGPLGIGTGIWWPTVRQSGDPIPAGAILDADGNPILDSDGNYILET